MKVVIVEDETLAAEKLQRLLEQLDSNIEILQVLESVEDAVNWFSGNALPDLIFMDIQLDDGISFEIFDAVKIEAPVIFTTAYDKYAIRAFKVNSVDYLLKPIELESLESAISKFKKVFLENVNFEAKISQVFKQLSKSYKSRFFIKVGTKYQSIQVEEICAFFVEERNTFLRTQKGKTYDLDNSLEQLQKLIDPNLFFRINRNYMVNINCIDEIISYSTSRLKLKIKNGTNDDLIVSRDKVSEFKRWMDR
ncbi:MAG: response regulator transcription factor [Bacteroidetes bacterium]|nr:response regulator transcription factor [Bacteroidota bacterium]